MTLNRTLNADDLNWIVEGAAFLGSGGGGPLELTQPLIDYMAQHGLWPKVVSFDQAAEGHVGMVAGMGSPSAAAGSGSAFTKGPLRLVQKMEKLLGNSFNYLIPGETGPMNSLIPLLVAAQQGIPALDGDGAGRAMSTLGMSTFNAAAAVRPLLVGNEPSNGEPPITAQLSLDTPEQADQMCRSVVTAPVFGSVGAFSTWPSTRGALNKVAVHGSLSLCWLVGKALVSCQQQGGNPYEALQAIPELAPRMRFLGYGKISDVTLETSGGFDRLTVQLAASSGQQLTLMGLNENMIAWSDSQAAPVCMGPDSICYVSASGQAFSNASIQQYRTSQEDIYIVGLTADPALLTPAILSAYRAVLEQLGYAGAWQPLQTNQAS